MRHNTKRIMTTIALVLLLTFVSACGLKPSINVNIGDDIIPLYGDFRDQGCTITIQGEDYLMTRSVYPLDKETVGQYIIQYEYEYKDEIYVCERMVFVVDETRPEVTLNEGIDTLILGTEWIDAGVTYTDNYDTELTLDIEGQVDYNSIGRYMITYTVTDLSNNETEMIRYVTVIEE